MEGPKLPTARLVDDSFGVTVSDGGQGVLHDLANRVFQDCYCNYNIFIYACISYLYIYNQKYIQIYALCINACIYYNYIYKII